jgi:lysine N6-hydroxylase
MKDIDLAGIGIGPFNLGLAALLAPISRIRAHFFERQESFDWHPGMMLPGTRMQTSFLKDLVTPVDPTSPYSFLSYLVKKGRFYRFINADFPRVRRIEFADYLRWVAEQLPNLSFGRSICEVDFDGSKFRLSFSDGSEVRCNNLAVGTGLVPHVPLWAVRHQGGSCLHSHTYVGAEFSAQNRIVAIVGGGQSGAEIFLDLMEGRRGRPAQILWITRRPGLDPLDETAFTNEYFTPDYVSRLHGLPSDLRVPIVQSQKLTGDGVSPATLQELSQYLYDSDFLNPAERPYRIIPHREVRAMAKEKQGYRLHMRNGFDQTDETAAADIVIVATGYRYRFPDCLAPIAQRISRDDEGYPELSLDYAARWDGPPSHRIYMQNAGRNSHGVADAQLSLTAWRSAVIINSLLQNEIYPTRSVSSPLSWTDSVPRDWGESYEAAPAARILPR